MYKSNFIVINTVHKKRSCKNNPFLCTVTIGQVLLLIYREVSHFTVIDSAHKHTHREKKHQSLVTGLFHRYKPSMMVLPKQPLLCIMNM